MEPEDKKISCCNCGREMPDGSQYCPACGKKQEPEEQVQPEEQAEPGKQVQPEEQAKPEEQAEPEGQAKPEEQAKPGKQVQPEETLLNRLRDLPAKSKKIIGISIAAAIGLFVVIGCLISSKPSVNLNDYLTVTFEGYETVGKAVVKFDDEQFEEDYGEKLAAICGENGEHMPETWNEALDDLEAYVEALLDVDAAFNFYLDTSPGTSTASQDFLIGCVNGMVDKKEGLSNGDVVRFSWKCNDEFALEAYGFKLKYKDVEFKVEGLEEAETFDPFEGIDVVFGGVSPNGRAYIEGRPKTKAAQYLQYDFDRYTGLSNGDKVTVTVSMYFDDPVEYCIEHYGMIPSPLTKEYKVEGLHHYIEKISDVSADSLADMQKQAEDVYHADAANNWEEGADLKNLTYIGNYLLTNKEQNPAFGAKHNALYLVYKAQVENKYSSDDGKEYNETHDIYWYICYFDLTASPEGVTTVDTAKYTTPEDEFTIDSGLSLNIPASVWTTERTKSWDYSGYQTLAELYKAVVTKNAEYFNHEDNVEAEGM